MYTIRIQLEAGSTRSAPIRLDAPDRDAARRLLLDMLTAVQDRVPGGAPAELVDALFTNLDRAELRRNRPITALVLPPGDNRDATDLPFWRAMMPEEFGDWPDRR